MYDEPGRDGLQQNWLSLEHQHPLRHRTPVLVVQCRRARRIEA